MQIVWEIIQLLLSIAEVGMCLMFSDLLIPHEKERWYHKLVKVIVVGILSILLLINRKNIFISHILFPIKALIMTLPICIIQKTRFFKTLGIYLAYFSSIGLFQILYSFILLLFMNNNQFLNLVYRNITPWRLLIYFMSFVSILGFYWLLKKQRNLQNLLNMNIQRPLLIYGLFGWWMIAWGQVHIVIFGHKWTIWSLGTLLFTFVVIITVSKLFMNSVRNEAEANLIAQKEQMLANYYNDIKKIYENSLFTSHDMKNHIIVLRNYAHLNDTDKILSYLDKIGKPIDRLSQTIWCNNEVVNLIVNTKLLEASEHQIKIITDIENISYTIDEPDLCCILSNLLDNAIEANMFIEPDYRWLKISICETPAELVIRLENALSVTPVPKKKWFLSAKAGTHGYGLKSIENTIQKYGGVMHCTYESNIFCTNISFKK